jgi:hypothetical protein
MCKSPNQAVWGVYDMFVGVRDSMVNMENPEILIFTIHGFVATQIVVSSLRAILGDT